MQNAISLNLPVLTRRASPRFNFKIFWALSLVLAAAFLLFYIFQVNNLVSNNYSVQKMEKNLKVLSQEKERLEGQFAGMASLGSFESLIENRQFEKISQIKYIQVPDNSVAVAK